MTLLVFKNIFFALWFLSWTFTFFTVIAPLYINGGNPLANVSEVIGNLLANLLSGTVQY